MMQNALFWPKLLRTLRFSLIVLDLPALALEMVDHQWMIIGLVRDRKEPTRLRTGRPPMNDHWTCEGQKGTHSP
jgi:hypothetical protein